MTAQTFQPIAPRPAPVNTAGPVAWIKSNLFADIKTSLGTLLLGGLLLWCLPQLFHLGISTAVWVPSFEACRAPGAGACWGVVVEKFRVIIFGRYNFDEQWRPLLATSLMVGLLIVSCIRAFWKAWLGLAWVAVLAAFFILMAGGVFGLSKIETGLWGGLPLTIMLSTLSLAMSFPLALLVALGRRSKLPAIRTFSTIYVELIRGVPLISVLFMASFMFPLFMPQGGFDVNLLLFSFHVPGEIDVLIRVLAGITLFSAAYLAEVIDRKSVV